MSKDPFKQNLKHNDYYHNRFNSQHYLDAYNQGAGFPKIHNGMAEMIAAYANEAEAAIEWGGCIGLLAARALTLGRTKVTIYEGNEDHIRRGVQLPGRLEWRHTYVVPEMFGQMEDDIQETGATLLIARRVISEVGIQRPEVVTEAAEVCWRAGINKVVLQGRVPHPSPGVPLWNTELEAKAMCDGGRFQVTRKSGPVWMLERIG